MKEGYNDWFGGEEGSEGWRYGDSAEEVSLLFDMLYDG